MPGNALYTDLSAYYDLMCADIDYAAQSHSIQRLQQLFGNGGKRHLDLACGTGPHVRHFLDAGYQSTGLDLNQPMLDRAAQRCPEAHFSQQDMCEFVASEPQDLITCFLYSLHYSGSLERLNACLSRVHTALAPGGLFCFNAVAKDKIDNSLFASHTAVHDQARFTFSSGWHYSGAGEAQTLRLRIERRSAEDSQVWDDAHSMVAVSFEELQTLLAPHFEVHVFEHDYEKLVPWGGETGNGVFVCVKR